MSMDKDVMIGAYREYDLAVVYALTGHSDEALDRLEMLLSIPSLVTTTVLDLDPTWDPIRDEPRFQALVSR